MIIFSLATISYIIILVFYRPSPKSLKGTSISIKENFKTIKVSLLSGIILLFIFLVVTQFSFTKVDEHLYSIFGLTNTKEAAKLWPLQFFSHLVIHADTYHVLSNVFAIGLASMYERRAGSTRFFKVLMVGALSSVPSILFYYDTVTISGISGGIFALAAAYFTDFENLTTPEWISAILMFLIVAFIFSISGNGSLTLEDDLQVDHLGHFMGALGGIVYCRVKPIKFG
jgi:membrane associated rhomboid family serine protease